MKTAAIGCLRFRGGACDGGTAKFGLYVDVRRLSLVCKTAYDLSLLARAHIPEQLVDFAFRQVDETLAVFL
jgi:hypothetical protein